MSNKIFNQKILTENAVREVNLEKHNLQERRKKLEKWIEFHKTGNLKNYKEESLQGEFLNEIFSGVLNYKNSRESAEEWHLEREAKTKIDGTKADGMLGFFTKEDLDKKKISDKVRVVIELKAPYFNLDQKQKRQGDNRTAVEQAFGYVSKYGNGNCQWVIVSNYYEIRLYTSLDQSKYEYFNLDMLQETENFQKFIYLLSKTSLIGDGGKHTPKTKVLFEENIAEEKRIEKQFYTLYKSVRENVFKNLVANNREVNEELLLEKTQKLMDRFLFIAFAEDKGLLPRNSYESVIVKKGKEYLGIFEMFKTFCNWINSGNKQFNINRYNGGLFKEDTDLDGLLIEDAVFEELEKIAQYDFSEQVNEHILGHIFEQSITDLEEIKSSLQNKEYDQKEGKRKKTGVFYTPKYITRHIVETTIGNWLEDKKAELGYYELPEIKEFWTTKGLSVNAKKHLEFWKKYRDVVKNMKIIDPACGSGAFLIEAFDYLMKISEYIKEQIASFNISGSYSLTEDITSSILLNNIYGVDLSAESVEITKLALWLKTADPSRPLENLDENIKHGNSVVDDKQIDENFAFNWNEEFSEIFENGGFDIVIGNPPYVRQESIKEIKPHLQKNYTVYTGVADLYCYFYELGYKLLKKDSGYLGFITSNKWFRAKYGQNLRQFLLENTEILEIIDYNGIKIFDGATVDSNIIVFKAKKDIENINEMSIKIGDSDSFKLKQNSLSSEMFVFSHNEEEISIKEKIEKIGKPLKEWEISINYGVKTGLNDAFIINKETRDMLINADFKNSEVIKPLLRGRDIKKYDINFAELYLIAFLPSKKYNIEDYPVIKEFMLNNIGYDKLKQTGDKGSRKKTKHQWFETQDTIAYWKDFEKEKIVYAEMVQSPQFYYDKDGYNILNTAYLIVGKNLKYLIAFLNSNFITYAFKKYYSGGGLGKNGLRYIRNFVEKLPIKPYENEAYLEDKVTEILATNKKISDYKILLERAKSNKKYDEIIDLEKLLEDSQLLVQKLEYEINQDIYKIYGLTQKEIDFIEKNI